MAILGVQRTFHGPKIYWSFLYLLDTRLIALVTLFSSLLNTPACMCPVQSASPTGWSARPSLLPVLCHSVQLPSPAGAFLALVTPEDMSRWASHSLSLVLLWTFTDMSALYHQRWVQFNPAFGSVWAAHMHLVCLALRDWENNCSISLKFTTSHVPATLS